MILSAIVAVSENKGIGKNNDLLWRLPDEVKFFKETTSGHAVIMGRKTLESLKRPLPNRTNIVITRRRDYRPEGVTVCHSVPESREIAQSMGETEAFLIGGGEIYESGLKHCDRIYYTLVHAVFDADVFFPEFDMSEWEEVSRVEHGVDERHAYAYTIFVYDRIRTA
jgi:dihydrofolate reductase